MDKEKRVYFHVGTGKAASTYLQYRVFPNFFGVHYIQRTRYKKALEIVQSGNHEVYLLSREFDRQLEYEVGRFADKYPNCRPIIVLRRHDSYIASQYRRFVKNGYRKDFKSFFDVHGNTGYFKHKHIDYKRQIEVLEAKFDLPPIVLIYEDLVNDPVRFVQKLAQLLGSTINYEQLNFERYHASYPEKQLKAILKVGRYLNLRNRKLFKNSVLQFLYRFVLAATRYSILLIAKFLPRSWFSKEPLIRLEELNEVHAYFLDDWTFVLDYAVKSTHLTED